MTPARRSFDAELRDFSSTSVFPFSLSTRVAGGGAVKLEGKAGPIDESDVAMTPFQATWNVAQLDLAGSGLAETSPGVAGLVSFDGNAEARGGSVQLTGKLKVDKLKLARQGTPAQPTLMLDFTIQHDLRRQSGEVHRGDIHLGKALASLTGTYARRGDSTVLQMKLSGPDMPITELAAMLPAMGIVLPAGSSLQGGTANARFDLAGPVDRLVTSGSLAFQNTKLTGFDLGRKMATVEKLAGINPTPDTEIRTLSANLRMAPEGISAEDLKLIVPAVGELSGGGTISPANVLNFRMSAAVHTGALLAALSDKPIPFLVEGTCSDPAFRPDLRAAEAKVKSMGVKAAGNLLKGLLGGKKH